MARLAVLLVVVLAWGAGLAPLAAAGTGGDWDPLAPLALPRQETGAARVGGTIYVVGGLQPGFPFQADATVEAYAIATGTWSFVTPLPVAGGLDHMGVVAWGGRVYVMGGYSGDFAARDETWIYDPALDAWSAGADMPAPRGACWAVTHGERIYVLGGENAAGQPTASTFVYDPAADSWSVGAPFTMPREHLTAATSGDFVYVIGGRTGASTNVNERYHPATDTWTTMAPMPTARSAMAVAELGGRIHVAGGETPQLFAVHEVYDVATDTWSCAAPMPLPRHGVAAVALFDRIVLPGGGTIQGLQPTTFVDSFVPQDHPWVALGDGLAGAGGVPYLSAYGSLGAGSTLRLVLEDAPAAAIATLVVGAGVLGAPFKGGVLVPPPDVLLPIPTDASGAFDVTGTWPAGVPSGVAIVLQAWIPDASGPKGFVSSGAAQGTTP